MTESLLTRTLDDGDADDRRAPYRPAKPQFGLSRKLRRIAGVNEAILDWVPEERPRYTRLGAIVLNTGIMAALSILILLRTINIPVILMIPVAGIWGYLILSFDGWLVASTHGVLNASKFRVYLPRLVISLLMGAVIAEPLLLWVFGTAIETEVRDQRKAVIDNYEGNLKRCNPLTGEQISSGDCAEYLLNVENPLVAIRKDLTDKNGERGKVQNAIADINDELTRREELARLECNGTSGPGLTGRIGVGPNCRRNREEADRYRASSNIDQHQQALVTLNDDIAKLTSREASAAADYAVAIQQNITNKVTEKRNNQSAIGILDQDKALGTLASRSTFVWAGSWVLRMLLIAIDCLPVLTKLMSRTTTYDILVSRQLDISSRLHDKYTSEREQRDSGRVDVSMQRNEHFVRTEMGHMDDVTRSARADKEAQLEDEIERLAARLRNGQ